ncbi:MAG: VWA domain-containing protein [Deltaproteobacteria bacterium]|nr:MAG: VWA domain-containing protein [Deltaproteobacteria bacterium]
MPRRLLPRLVARLRYRGLVLADRVLHRGEALTVGEDPRCDFVVPDGGAQAHFRPMLDPAPPTWASCGGGKGAKAGCWVLSAHPEVTLEVESLDAEPPPFAGWRGFRPATADVVAAATVACLAAVVAWSAPRLGGPGAFAPRVRGADGPVRLVAFGFDPESASGPRGRGSVARPRLGVLPGPPSEGARSVLHPRPAAAEEAADPTDAEIDRPPSGAKISVPTPGGADRLGAGSPAGTLASTEDGGQSAQDAAGVRASDPEARSEATAPSATGDGGVRESWFSRCLVSRPAAHTIRRAQVVFVLDVSTTMNTALPAVLESADAVGRALGAHGTVAPADVAKLPEGVELGVVAYVDDAVLVRPGAPWARSMHELAPWLGPILARAAGNAQLTTDTPNHDWPENALDALHLAATGLAWDRRDDTARFAVWVTDDGFADAGTMLSAHVPVRHGYAETISALGERGVKVLAFAARRGGPSEDEDVEAGIFAPWHDMRPIPEATSGGALPIDVLAEGPDRLARVIANVLSTDGGCMKRR